MYGRLGLKQSLSRSSHSTSRASVADDCAVLGDVLRMCSVFGLLLLVLPPSSVLPGGGSYLLLH